MKNTELELEAEKANGYNLYAKDTKGQAFNEGYIAGATSKYVEKQKLEFAIEQLKGHTVHNVIPYVNRIDVINKIKELQEKLQGL